MFTRARQECLVEFIDLTEDHSEDEVVCLGIDIWKDLGELD